MKRISASFILLAMLLLAIFVSSEPISAKSPTVSVAFQIRDDKTGSTLSSEFTALLFDEDGNLLRRYNSVSSTFNIDIPAAAVDAPSKNYALRIIADDGSIGVRYFADREIESNTKVLTSDENVSVKWPPPIKPGLSLLDLNVATGW